MPVDEKKHFQEGEGSRDRHRSNKLKEKGGNIESAKKEEDPSSRDPRCSTETLVTNDRLFRRNLSDRGAGRSSGKKKVVVETTNQKKASSDGVTG